ncbi:SUKH-4 family immunity protein [uncultured Gimesia sp.]|uniref:SUKH-4 family immunity protein n=1 Tax=uncultured Gimesia sp. TaxID=1678688 RepID=UPI0030D9BA6F|tara:strand:- start:37733 stop:38296 length:564 start_codon:yes stop_codon:yes gene_type:complete
MTPDEFRDRWCDDEDEELVLFSADALAGISIPEESREFLTSSGLPESAAPFLGFGTSGRHLLPSVADAWNKNTEFRRYREIGNNDSGDTVCLDEAENGQVVFLNHDLNFKRVLMNSSIPALAESLVAYRQLVRDTQERNGEDAWLDGDVPDDLKEWLIGELKRIDPVVIQPDCFWGEAIENLQEERA